MKSGHNYLFSMVANANVHVLTRLLCITSSKHESYIAIGSIQRQKRSFVKLLVDVYCVHCIIHAQMPPLGSVFLRSLAICKPFQLKQKIYISSKHSPHCLLFEECQQNFAFHFHMEYGLEFASKQINLILIHANGCGGKPRRALI